MPETTREQLLKTLYRPSAKEPVLVRVPKMNFLMVDGQGNPAKDASFQEAIGALYGVAYTMKFMFDKGHPVRAARVGALEGLFWTGRRAGNYVLDYRRRKLHWTLMLLQPPVVTRRTVNAAIRELRAKKDPPGLDGLRFEGFAEGRAVQVMHIGPYSAEMPTIEKLFGWAGENGWRVSGRHHEIYLSDPRRTKPEKLRTVIRYAVTRS